MEQDHRGEAARGQEEASAGVEPAVAGGAGHDLDQDPVGIVSALVVGQGFPIKQGILAIT